VYKRPSGGETVVLTPNTLVISIKITLDKFSDPKYYFKYFNQKIIDGLENLGIKDVSYRGISDVALKSKKILGSSIYRKRKALFYHAVLNVSEPVETIERYIKHPTKEPDYRKGRAHKEFVTSLYNEGYPFSADQIRDSLKVALSGINEDKVILNT
ncbi:MAG: lipoate--protein ligase family protein, partial [Bacteroidota bacterium]